ATNAKSAFVRSTNLRVISPDFLCVSFSLEVSGVTVVSPTAAQFMVGSDFSQSTSITTEDGKANAHSKIGIGFTATPGEFTIRNTQSGSNEPNTYSGMQTIKWFINNSGKKQSYTAPDGSVETLADGKWDLWVGTTREFNERPATTVT